MKTHLLTSVWCKCFRFRCRHSLDRLILYMSYTSLDLAFNTFPNSWYFISNVNMYENLAVYHQNMAEVRYMPDVSYYCRNPAWHLYQLWPSRTLKHLSNCSPKHLCYVNEVFHELSYYKAIWSNCSMLVADYAPWTRRHPVLQQMETHLLTHSSWFFIFIYSLLTITIIVINLNLTL